MSNMHAGATRREWLKRGGALGGAMLGGCACPLPSWPIGTIPQLGRGVLAPPPAQGGSLELPIVIDAHCHIFNVEDVPASPLLKGPVAHGLKQFPAKLIIALADVIAAIAYVLAPSARAEVRLLEQLSAQHRDLLSTRSPLAARSVVYDQRESQRQNFIRAFAEAARDPRFARRYRLQLERHDQASLSANGALRLEQSLSEEAIYRILINAPPLTDATISQSDPRNLVRFAYTLTSPRYLNLAAMQDIYSGGPGVPAIDAFCPSLLDLDHWLGCKDTATTQDDQMRLLEQLALMSGGAILPFIAYNPRSDVEHHDRSFARVVDAILNRGFVGVKLYPPMGYMAYGNACPSRPGACPVMQDARAIDARLRRLYEWCVDHNVPIMGHTSHSFGKTDAYDDCASPFGWQRALETFDGLRVQAGHFGGDSDYALKHAWAASYVEMMGTPQGRHLHADLSNLGELFEPGTDVRKVLEPLFSAAWPGMPRETAADRMIYGSDWYMTQMSAAADGYARQMSSYLGRLESEIPMPQLRQRVFGQNAVRLYGLEPGPLDGHPSNWDRLRTYYASKDIPAPRWMRKLGGA